MKKRFCCSVFLPVFLILLLLLSACGGPDGKPTAPEEPRIIDETAPIQWREPALEALVREKLGKTSGEDIYPTDLDHVWGVELFGESHIFFNGDGGGVMYASPEYIDPERDLEMPAETIGNPSAVVLQYGSDEGKYSIGGVEYDRGSIASISDFANFRNLKCLAVWKNDLKDVSGLSGLTELVDLCLSYDNIKDLSGLAGLKQLAFLALDVNAFEDVAPLGDLTQLRELKILANPVKSVAPLFGLTKLENMVFSYTEVRSLAGLETMESLRVLGFAGTPVDDLTPIAGLRELRTLYFDKSKVKDLTPISGLTNLTGLGIAELDVDEVDLSVLRGLHKLRYLSVGQDKAKLVNLDILLELEGMKSGYLYFYSPDSISQEDLNYLKKSLPYCDIGFD